ncbi:MAG: PHP domain-containing protein [Deltaproteobacteria bacterium]|nr:PHP domain-containing protein [Deltaproteobacteria bacterium]
MLSFMRNKLVTITRKDQSTLLAHGVLDDDIYGLELDVTIGIPSLRINGIEGKWNYWTTPECPRVIPFLQEAVGFSMGEDGFSQKVHKIIGRRACRHFANLLLECCHTAKEAAGLLKREDEKRNRPESVFEQGIDEEPEQTPSEKEKAPIIGQPFPNRREGKRGETRSQGRSGVILDLHVHTTAGSSCSNAPVDALIDEAKMIGLDGICLTDHNHLWDPHDIEDLRQRHGFLVLRGNEITTDQGDMLVFGLDRDIRGIVTLEKLREGVTGAHGFIIVAHPFRGFLTFGVGQLGLTPAKAAERSLFRYVDAVEAMNSKVTEKENRFAADVAEKLGLPITGGSDAHEVGEAGIYATRFDVPIGCEGDLVEALHGGRYSPVAYRMEMGLKEAMK